ncbi:unnamed protein product [Hermetia illucens]|uniref:Peptidase C1A papain C-terminal domain-containing protein n=1 Tax=Hermetia illucens TaxID=343691 RepID=A0A7R8UWX8_HERIL|nr:unnamed protein product [Hermetia illucens]
MYFIIHSSLLITGIRKVRKNFQSINKHNEEYEEGCNPISKKLINLLTSPFKKCTEGSWVCTSVSSRAIGGGSSIDLNILELDDNEVPDSIDWREKGYVTPVKNQGDCCSCWAFSAVDSLEGHLYKATKKPASLSEQELIYCSLSNWGCIGGWIEPAFKDLKRLGGITTEESYPYNALNNKCALKKRLIVAEVPEESGSPCGTHINRNSNYHEISTL